MKIIEGTMLAQAEEDGEKREMARKLDCCT